MEIDYKAMGRRIAQKRHERKLTQRQVCESIDIDDKYLSIIENAKSIPSLDVVSKICDRLNTTLDFIVFGKPDVLDVKEIDELYHSLTQMSSANRQFMNAVIKVLKEQNVREV